MKLLPHYVTGYVSRGNSHFWSRFRWFLVSISELCNRFSCKKTEKL